MDEATLRYYDENSTACAERYRQADVTHLHAILQRWLKPGQRVLEIGCGCGRDAAFMAQLGCDVLATDASARMLASVPENWRKPVRYQQAAFPLSYDDRLLKQQFDAVVAVAMLMHVPDGELLEVLYQARSSLQDNGVLVLSVCPGRIRTPADQRLYVHREPYRLQLLLQGMGFRMVSRNVTVERPCDGVEWTTFVFEADGVFPDLPLSQLVRMLLLERHTTTYKPAFFRALCDVALTDQEYPNSDAEDAVCIPLGLLVEKWIQYYWPVFESQHKLPEIRPHLLGGKLAFRDSLRRLMTASQPGGLAGFSSAYANDRLSAAQLDALHEVAVKIADAMVKGPLTHIGDSQGRSGQAFTHGGYLLRKRCTTRREFRHNFGIIHVPRHYWKGIVDSAYWIREASIVQWARLSHSFAKSAVPIGEILSTLAIVPSARPLLSPGASNSAADSKGLGLREAHEPTVDSELASGATALGSVTDLTAGPVSDEVPTQPARQLPADVVLDRKGPPVGTCAVAPPNGGPTSLPHAGSDVTMTLGGILNLDAHDLDRLRALGIGDLFLTPGLRTQLEDDAGVADIADVLTTPVATLLGRGRIGPMRLRHICLSLCKASLRYGVRVVVPSEGDWESVLQNGAPTCLDSSVGRLLVEEPYQFPPGGEVLAHETSNPPQETRRLGVMGLDETHVNHVVPPSSSSAGALGARSATSSNHGQRAETGGLSSRRTQDGRLPEGGGESDDLTAKPGPLSESDPGYSGREVSGLHPSLSPTLAELLQLSTGDGARLSKLMLHDLHVSEELGRTLEAAGLVTTERIISRSVCELADACQKKPGLLHELILALRRSLQRSLGDTCPIAPGASGPCDEPNHTACPMRTEEAPSKFRVLSSFSAVSDACNSVVSVSNALDTLQEQSVDPAADAHWKYEVSLMRQECLESDSEPDALFSGTSENSNSTCVGSHKAVARFPSEGTGALSPGDGGIAEVVPFNVLVDPIISYFELTEDEIARVCLTAESTTLACLGLDELDWRTNQIAVLWPSDSVLDILSISVALLHGYARSAGTFNRALDALVSFVRLTVGRYVRLRPVDITPRLFPLIATNLDATCRLVISEHDVPPALVRRANAVGLYMWDEACAVTKRLLVDSQSLSWKKVEALLVLHQLLIPRLRVAHSQRHLCERDMFHVGTLSRLLEPELMADIQDPRNLSILVTRLGLDSSDEATLQQVASQYGLTRERVRQIESKALKRLSNSTSHLKRLRPFWLVLESILTIQYGAISVEECSARLSSCLNLSVLPSSRALEHLTHLAPSILGIKNRKVGGRQWIVMASASCPDCDAVLHELIELVCREGSVSVDAACTHIGGKCCQFCKQAPFPTDSVPTGLLQYLVASSSAAEIRLLIDGNQVALAPSGERARYRPLTAKVLKMLASSPGPVSVQSIYDTLVSEGTDPDRISVHQLAALIVRQPEVLQWDRSVFVHCKHMQVPTELLERIEDWLVRRLQCGDVAVSVRAARIANEEECSRFGLTTDFSVYSVLRRHSSALAFPKYPQVTLPSQPARVRVESLVEEHLLAKQGPVSLVELRDQFVGHLGLKGFQLSQALSQNRHLLRLDRNHYVHADVFIRLHPTARSSVRSLAREALELAKDGHVVTVSALRGRHKVDCNIAGIETHQLLASLLALCASDLVQLRGGNLVLPVGDAPRHDISLRRLVCERVRGARRPVTIDELGRHFVESIGYSMPTLTQALSAKDLTRYTSDAVVHVETLGWSHNKSLTLEQAALQEHEAAVKSGRVCALVSSLIESTALPALDNELVYTQTCLADLLSRCRRILVLGRTKNAFVARDNPANVKDLESLVGEIVRTEFHGGCTIAQLESYLVSHGIVASRLPKRFFDHAAEITMVGADVFLRGKESGNA